MGAPWAIVGLQGFWKPFDRETIEGRYRDREDYVRRCSVAAELLIEQGFLLLRDLPEVEDRAARMYGWVTSNP